MSTSEAYAGIPRAQLTYDYLHTNSTTHEFLFGALAELVDNARDAASKRIDIYSEPAEAYRGKYLLCFLDDGDGMDPDEVNNVIKFGRSDKRIIDKNMIGQYGNGLKSGTMRIAKDMILFTKKENKLSCLMISRTFHEREKINEILIPMPNWNGKTKTPLYRKHRDAQQHKTEVDIITKYSPFKTQESLLAQFDKIKATGTLVILYNLQLMDNGLPELDVTTDPYDILMGDPYAGETYGDDNSVAPERKSFRAYTAILYLDPKMKIYIQNKKVRTVRLATSLYKPASYTFTSKRFKCRLEKEEKKAEQELKIAEAKAKELEMQEREEREKAENETSKDAFSQHRQAGERLASARADVNIKKMTYENTKKALKEPQTLDFIFGINLNKRQCCGVMVYNCNRLIKMYQKVGCQTDGGVQGFGVMGIVNVPYLVLEPTHNKQDFADGKEYKALIKALGEHLDDYWKNCPIAKQGVRFWDSYGYTNSSNWKADPSNEERYVRKRMMELPLYVQCDRCLKWRKLDFHSKYIKEELPADWCCKNNPDTDCNNCQRPEKKPARLDARTLNKPKLQRTATATSTSTTTTTNTSCVAPTRENRQANARVQAVQRETRRQPPPPKEPQRPVAQRQVAQKPVAQKPVTQKPIRPCPPQPRPVVTAPSSSVSARPKPQTTTASKKQEQRPTSSPARASARQIKQEKPQTQQRKPGRPKADSTEEKQEPKLKRPHPDNNVKEIKDGVKRRKSDVVQSPVISEPEVDSNDNEMDWTSDREAEASRSPAKQEQEISELDMLSLQGRLCEAKVEGGQWYAATITCVKQVDGGIRAKVKFQQYQNNKFDKWYDYPGSDIRLDVTTSDSVVTPPSPVNHPSPQPSSLPVELPSTTTSEQPAPVSLPSSPVASPDNTVSSVSDRVEDLAALTRKLLEFFVPPHYHLTKEQLRSMSVQELRDFSVSEFCKKYEDDLGQLMNNVTSKSEKALEEVKKKYDDVVTERDRQATELQQKTLELTRVTQQCEQHKIALHQKTSELSRVTTERNNLSVALQQKIDEVARVTQRDQQTANLLLQKTQELSRVSRQLTSLRGKTAQLIGMLNDGAEVSVSEESVENYIDNYITLLQNDGAWN